MLDALTASLGRAALDRLTLLINHVLDGEPAAKERLKPHTGRSIEVVWQQWPGLLPTPPSMVWGVTPAGLLERVEQPAESGLTVELRFDELPRWLAAAAHTGEHPPMEIRGDAQFAADVSWLADNVRWDIEADLARVIGDAPAHQIARVGRGALEALRRFVAKRGA